MPFYSGNCIRNCHAGSFPACHGTSLLSLHFFQSQEICLSAPPEDEGLPLWEERKRNTIICLLITSLPTTEGGPVGAPRFWRRERHSGVSQHKALAQDIPAPLVLFGTVPSHPTTLLLTHRLSLAWDETFLPTYQCSHLCSHRNQQRGWRNCWDNIHVATMTSDTWNKAVLRGRDCYRRRQARTQLHC